MASFREGGGKKKKRKQESEDEESESDDDDDDVPEEEADMAEPDSPEMQTDVALPAKSSGEGHICVKQCVCASDCSDSRGYSLRHKPSCTQQLLL